MRTLNDSTIVEPKRSVGLGDSTRLCLWVLVDCSTLPSFHKLHWSTRIFIGHEIMALYLNVFV